MYYYSSNYFNSLMACNRHYLNSIHQTISSVNYQNAHKCIFKNQKNYYKLILKFWNSMHDFHIEFWNTFQNHFVISYFQILY